MNTKFDFETETALRTTVCCCDGAKGQPNLPNGWLASIHNICPQRIRPLAAATNRPMTAIEKLSIKLMHGISKVRTWKQVRLPFADIAMHCSFDFVRLNAAFLNVIIEPF